MNSSVDVVRIIARLNLGGPARHVIGLTSRMAARYSTALVFGDVDVGEGDLSADAAGLRVLRIPELGRRVRAWHDLVTFVRLVAYLRQVRPRIVHTHTAKAGTLGRLAAVVARVPVRVHTYHGHVFHGYFSSFATRIVIAIERVLARATTKIVAISPSQATDLVERFRICESSRIRVVPLGLDLDRFAPALIAPHRKAFRDELQAADDVCVITIVGRLVPIKNHGLFLDAAARMAGSGQSPIFVVVGDGTETDRLKRRAAQLGIGGSVRFLGWRTDLEAVYAGSDIIVLTSNNEGTPLSLIEALAAGRPVVATDVGGVTDVLEHGRLGVLVPPRDIDALAAALTRLSRDTSERAGFERRGPESAMKRYSLDRLADDIASLYDELLGIDTTSLAAIPLVQKARA